MAADVFARDAGQRAAEVVGADERAAGELVSEGRVGIAIDLALGVGGDDQRALRDGQVGADIGDGVVAADVFGRDAGERAAVVVGADERAAGELVSEGRVGIAIDLALGVGGDDQRALRDGQVGADIEDGVVGAGGQGVLLDRVGAHVFTGHTAQGAAEAVATDERATGKLIGQGGVAIAIHLGLCVGSDRQRPRRNRAVCAYVGERIVGSGGQGTLLYRIGAHGLA